MEKELREKVLREKKRGLRDRAEGIERAQSLQGKGDTGLANRSCIPRRATAPPHLYIETDRKKKRGK